MTRILALVTDAYGGAGGIAQATRDLLEAAVDTGAAAEITILPRAAAGLGSAPPRSGIAQMRPVPGRLGYAVRALAAAVTFRPDVVFCNHLYMGPLALIAARLASAKFVLQLHGIEIWRRPTGPQRSCLEAADRVICVSRDTRARALHFADIDPERAIVVNNTVGAQFTPGNRDAARARFGLGPERVALSVGRLDRRERYKGHDRVIEALAGLSSAGERPVQYLIAGDGDDRPRLEALARELGVSDRVRFLGQVAAADLPDLYRAADVFVLPSEGEGFGIVFLEAMASGTPALGLAAGGACDALADGDLGGCVRAEIFREAFADALRRPPSCPSALSQAVQVRFGAGAFSQRVFDAFSTLKQPGHAAA